MQAKACRMQGAQWLAAHVRGILQRRGACVQLTPHPPLTQRFEKGFGLKTAGRYCFCLLSLAAVVTCGREAFAACRCPVVVVCGSECSTHRPCNDNSELNCAEFDFSNRIPCFLLKPQHHSAVTR